jgi:hypothetical protein
LSCGAIRGRCCEKLNAPLSQRSFPSGLTTRAVAGAVTGVAITAALLELPAALFAQTRESATATATAPATTPAPADGIAPAGRGTPGPCARRRLRPRCPDLIMSAPSHLHMDRSTRPGHLLLRATSSINNRGGGPLELRAHRAGQDTWAVYQAIYDLAHHRHVFRRPGRLVFKYVPGERYGYGDVGAQSYWKFEHAAAFALWSIDRHFKAIRLVRTGPKVDYCLRDLVRSRPSPESPSTPVYPACSQDAHVRQDVLGTSAGWSDVYPYEYPQQWIDVSGLRGRFAYVQIADPNDILLERNHRNDISETYVALPSGRVLGHRAAVAAP